MLRKLQSFVDRFTSRRALLLLAIVALGFFLFFNVSPWGVVRLQQYSTPEAGGMLDVRFHYTPQQVYTLFAALGEPGRHYYLFLLGFDFVFPAIYGILLAAVLLILSRRQFASASSWLFVLPLLGALCDYGENVGILTMLLAYGHKLIGVAIVTAVFTSAKWIVSGMAFLSIAILFAVSLVSAMLVKFRKRKHEEHVRTNI